VKVKFQRWLEELRRSETHLSLALSLMIGALVGLVVVAFILLTGRLAAHMYPAGGSGWRRVFVPVLGSLATGYLLYRYFPHARGSGIPQTKFALFINDGRISFRTVLGKFGCCSASLASGISLGREGPSVQVGAGLASVIARRLGFDRERVKAMVTTGCSAALAAAFNTPIAAVLFSLEEIVGDLHASVLGSAVLSSATSWMVLHLVLGDEPLFHVPAYHLVHSIELAVYAVLGVAGGLVSVAFVRLLLGLRARFLRMPKRTVWFQPIVGGLAVGLMGYFRPEVMGVGYDYIEKVLNGDLVIRIVVLLAILKLLATAICYASGNAGGIFGPSLFIGAMTGAAVGGMAHALAPGHTAAPGAYALVGMGTAFAGIVRAPFTSVIMVFEITRDYTIIVPLMVSNLIAFFISQKLQRMPIYEALALQDGVHLPTGELRYGLGRMKVSEAMRPASAALAARTPVRAALERMRASGSEVWPVVQGVEFEGMARRADLEAAAAGGADGKTLAELLGAGLPAQPPHLYPDQTLGVALERMGAAGEKALPVVSRANVRLLVGVVTLDDVLATLGVAQSAGERATRE
jgi:CIC family chloride channel protein